MSIAVARARSRAAQLLAIAATGAVFAVVAVAVAGVLESGLDRAVRDAAREPAAQLVVAGERAVDVATSVQTALGDAPVVIDDGPEGAVVTPDAARVGTGDLAVLRDALDRVGDALIEGGIASRTAVAGEMSDWAQTLIDASWRARVLALVPFLVIVVGGLVAARNVVRVLALSRIAELAVLRSRGASRSRVLFGELREIAIASALGALVGGAVAASVVGTPWPITAALVAAIVLAMVTIAIPVVRSATPRDRADEAAASSGRARAAGAVGLAVLFAAAALAVARLITTGSAADPLGIAAPALGVLAAAVLVLGAVSATARLADATTRRWVALGPALAVRRLARRLPLLATVVLLVSIAASTTVFAAAFGATSQQLARDLREVRVGGDLLVADWPADDDPDTLPADSVAPLLSSAGELGDDEPLILAAPADRFAAAVRPLADVVEPEVLAASIAAPVGGLRLPEGTSSFAATVVSTPGVVLEAWVLEASGRVRLVSLSQPVVGPVVAILAVDADVSRAFGSVRTQITELVAVTPAGSAIVELPTDWEPQFAAYSDFESGRFATTPELLGFELGRTSPADVHVRLMAPGLPFARIPAALSDDLAARNGLAVGDDVDVRFAGAGRNVIATVAATVPALPTAGDREAILVDYPAFAEQQLRITNAVPPATALVVLADDPLAVREALPAAATAVGREPGVADRMVEVVGTLLWVAAVGAAVLAAVGVSSTSASLVGERRRETRILTALGEPPARQARAQLLELGSTMVLALLGGSIAGAILAALTVPNFALASAPGSGVLPSVTLTVEASTGAAAFGLLVVLLAAVLVMHGARVVRDATRQTGGAS